MPARILFRRECGGRPGNRKERPAVFAATNDSVTVAMVDVLAPISVGELIDKITILRIKADKIRAGAAHKNVRHELERLMQIRAGLELAADLDAIEGELCETNLRLWKVEDDLRDLERLGDFGPRFVELARSVYTLNDRRSALKRRINEVTSSAIVDEKSYRPYG